MNTASPVLLAHNVSKRVQGPEGGLDLLQDITLEVNAGDSLAITGPSGSGKSTLLSLLAGLDVPTAGDVKLNGASFSQANEDERARLRGEQCGFVFQHFQLINDLTALENVMLPLELSSAENPVERARAALASVGLEHRTGHYPRQLSGGEKQRVAIARAFITEPALLFADEPTGNLDAASGDRVTDLLFNMNKEAGTTLILVTHDKTLANRCDRVYELEGGKFKA